MIRTTLILLSVFSMSVFLAPADADAACREGKFIIKPQADGSNLIVDECQPTVKAPRNAPAPKQEAKTPPQPATAETQPKAKAPIKTDILGFTLGMAEPEIIKRGATKGTCYIGLLDFDCFKNKDDEIEITLTRNLNPNVADEITYKFKSGKTPLDMISYTSEQYGIQPIKEDWDQKAKNATTIYVKCIPKTFLTDEVCGDALMGGTLATWQMSDESELQLKMENGVFNSARKLPDEYRLVLKSKKLSQSDAEARKQRDKEAVEKARGVNPNPKF